MTDPGICREHSGVCANVKNLENDVKTLFQKWDGIQNLLIGTLVSTVLCLIGVVFLLLRMK